MGGVNETRYDVAEIRGGRVTQAVQIKFVGNTPKECLGLLHSANYRTKYFAQGIKIEIPAEYYDEVLRLDPSLKGHIIKSSITKSEAAYSVKNSGMTTAREVAGVSHRAGLEGAKYGAGISGGISAVRNVCAVISGDKEAGKTLLRYFSGEIDGKECIAELQEKGAGTAGALAGAAAGQAVIPVPVVGAVVGSMLGYAISGELYRNLKRILDSARLAREERIRVERECAEAVKAIRDFRAKVEALISQYFTSHITTFHAAFDAMNEALSLGDADGFISGANMITEKLGGRVQFRNMKEFDALMDSEEAFVL